MTSTIASTQVAAGTAVALADICKRLEGSPLLGSLAQLFGAMASGCCCSEAVSNTATVEKSAGATNYAAPDAVPADVARTGADAVSTDEAETAEQADAAAAEDEVACSSGSNGIFTDDEIASLMIGFVAGVAVVGGGCLMYKLLKD